MLGSGTRGGDPHGDRTQHDFRHRSRGRWSLVAGALLRGTPSSSCKHRDGGGARAALGGGARRAGEAPLPRCETPPSCSKSRPGGSRPCRCGRGAGLLFPPRRGRGRGTAQASRPRGAPAARSMHGAAIPEDVRGLLTGTAGGRRAGRREGFPGGGPWLASAGWGSPRRLVAPAPCSSPFPGGFVLLPGRRQCCPAAGVVRKARLPPRPVPVTNGGSACGVPHSARLVEEPVLRLPPSLEKPPWRLAASGRAELLPGVPELRARARSVPVRLRCGGASWGEGFSSRRVTGSALGGASKASEFPCVWENLSLENFSFWHGNLRSSVKAIQVSWASEKLVSGRSAQLRGRAPAGTCCSSSPLGTVQFLNALVVRVSTELLCSYLAFLSGKYLCQRSWRAVVTSDHKYVTWKSRSLCSKTNVKCHWKKRRASADFLSWAGFLINSSEKVSLRGFYPALLVSMVLVALQLAVMWSFHLYKSYFHLVKLLSETSEGGWHHADDNCVVTPNCSLIFITVPPLYTWPFAQLHPVCCGKSDTEVGVPKWRWQQLLSLQRGCA